MSVNKEHKEFRALDMSTGREAPPSYPAGIQQKILAGGLDEAGKRGTRAAPAAPFRLFVQAASRRPVAASEH